MFPNGTNGDFSFSLSFCYFWCLLRSKKSRGKKFRLKSNNNNNNKQSLLNVCALLDILFLFSYSFSYVCNLLLSKPLCCLVQCVYSEPNLIDLNLKLFQREFFLLCLCLFLWFFSFSIESFPLYSRSHPSMETQITVPRILCGTLFFFLHSHLWFHFHATQIQLNPISPVKQFLFSFVSLLCRFFSQPQFSFTFSHFIIGFSFDDRIVYFVGCIFAFSPLSCMYVCHVCV